MIIFEKFSIYLYIGLLVVIRLLGMHHRKIVRSQSSQLQAFFKDPTAIIMAILAIIAFSSPITEAVIKTFPGDLIFQLTGSIMMLCGGMIAYFANREIAENWSPVIDKLEDQRLGTSGVYQYIRHPLYFAGLIIHIGSNIYFCHTWSWITTFLILVAILCRIPREEKALVEKFGDEYLMYKRKSRALIPGIF